MDFSNITSTFHEHGYVVVPDILTTKQCDTLNRRITSDINDEQDTYSDHFTNNPHRHISSIYSISTNSRLLDAIECIIGPNILLLKSTILIKLPGDRKFASWHQDSAYAPFHSDDILTVWLAITDYTPENGCLRIIPGSHKRPNRHHVMTNNENNILSRGQMIILSASEKKNAENILLETGDASIHHLSLVHASKPNESSDTRLSLGLIFLAPSVRPKTNDMAVDLVRGTDDFGYFRLLDLPSIHSAT